MPDFEIVSGDVQPSFAQQLTYSNGDVADLTGATVALQIRSLVSAAPLTLTGSVFVQDPPNAGIVQWNPSAADTANPGEYMSKWLVTFANGQQQTFPTTGWNWIAIEPSLTSFGQQLVGLADAKEYMKIPAEEHSIDDALMRAIRAVRPMVEKVTGPIIPQVFDEWYSGGSYEIALDHCPSYGYGTSPVFDLMAVSEYRGPAEFPLAIVGSPDLGSIYSAILDARMGVITRRAPGGGQIPFFSGAGFPGNQAVHVIYYAGQASVPDNVYEGTLELLRVNYQRTMQVGSGRRTQADQEDMGPRAMGYFMPRRVTEILAPSRGFPSLA